MDWDQNGAWVTLRTCLVNFIVPPLYIGPLSALLPPNFVIGPNAGLSGHDFPLLEMPVPLDWTGEGVFEDGETEDYLLLINQTTEEGWYYKHHMRIMLHREWPDFNQTQDTWKSIVDGGNGVAKHRSCWWRCSGLSLLVAQSPLGQRLSLLDQNCVLNTNPVGDDVAKMVILRAGCRLRIVCGGLTQNMRTQPGILVMGRYLSMAYRNIVALAMITWKRTSHHWYRILRWKWTRPQRNHKHHRYERTRYRPGWSTKDSPQSTPSINTTLQIFLLSKMKLNAAKMWSSYLVSIMKQKKVDQMQMLMNTNDNLQPQNWWDYQSFVPSVNKIDAINITLVSNGAPCDVQINLYNVPGGAPIGLQ